MTAKWNPSKYHDEYRDVLMKLVQRKVKAGQTEAIDVEAAEEEARSPDDQLHGRAEEERRAHASEERAHEQVRAAKPRKPARARQPTQESSRLATNCRFSRRATS